MNTRAFLTALVVMSLALFTSCGEDSITNPGPQYTRVSPEEVLAALTHALEEADIETYKECLSIDYRFEFLPEDCKRAGVPEKSPFWGPDQDIAAMDSLFRAPTARVLEAKFFIDTRWTDGEDSLARLDPWFRVLVRNDAGRDTILSVHYSWLEARFVRDDQDTSLWRIGEIREALRWGAATVPPFSSFGQIKSMFRRLEPCEISPRESLSCLLRNFELALERMDIAAYDACLSDEYLFEFHPVDYDAAGVVPDGPSWGKAQDMASMSAIFAGAEVTAIQCDLQVNAGPWPTEDGVGYRLDPYMVFAVVSAKGETLDLVVEGSWLDVEVVEDPYEPGRWVFREMRENLKEPLSSAVPNRRAHLTEGSTYGGIKAMFR